LPILSEKLWPIPALRIEPRLPAWAALFAQSLTSLALLSVWVSRVSTSMAVVLSLSVLLFAHWSFARVHRWRGALAIEEIHAHEGRFSVYCGGRWIELSLRPTSLVWQQLLLLECVGVAESGHASLMLCPSTMAAEDWRCLRLQVFRALELYRQSQG
jgi:hypothetical protein